MVDFIIYSKNGVAKHESKTAYNNDGEQVQTDSLEYHGSWMGECYISVDVKSAYPIDFQIGDYIDYRGERFTLANDPAVVKKSERGSYGEGFEYKDIKFSARQAELTDIRFLDYVLGDNELHYTSLPDFPFYAASIEDYADRLQANTNRWCQENGFILSGYDSVVHGYTQTDYWLFITPDRDRFIQRAAILRKDGDNWVGLTPAAAGAIWDASYPNGTNVSDEKKDISVTVSSEAISTALERIKKDFGLNFINRDRKVIIGAAGIETDHLFEYGKGHGLYEMERQVDNDQQVITKLYAYGSNKNLPVRYYADIQKEYYDYVRGYTVKDINHGYRKYIDMEMDMLFDSDLFTMELKDNWEFGSETLIHYEVEIRANDITVKAYAFSVGDVDSYKLHLYVMTYGDGRWESLTDPETFEAFVDAINKGDKVYFTKHIRGTEWPSDKYDYSNIGNTAYTSFVELMDAQHYTGEYINIEFIIDTAFDKKYFTTKSNDVDVYDGEGNPVDGYIISMHYDDYKATCLVWREFEGTHVGKCHVRMRWDSDATKEKDYYEHDGNKAYDFFYYRYLLQEAELIIDGGANYTYFPTIHTDYTEPGLPNNMAVSKLMLPGFPTQSLYSWVKSQPDCTAHDDATGQATWRGYTAIFSKEKYRPFILSVNSNELGIREASKNFDGSDDTDEIFPTLEGSGYDIVRVAEIMTDNGMIDDGEDTPTVKLSVPLFDDLDELVSENTEGGEAASIQMKDGFCGSRTLKIKNVVRKENLWEVECEREYDTLIQLYFPYSYNASIGERPTANEAYQIRGSNISGYDGDHFVYTGIPMSKTYIDAAAVKLLVAALEFLSKNEYTRYTFLPKIDDLYMSREYDDAVINSRTPLHDSIKEGDLLNFKDEDLLIPNSLVFIDSLTIKEDGNNGIPTYEVTLRTDKTVGTMQRIQNQITSMSSQMNNGRSSITIGQIDREIENYGRKMFLSKRGDDTAQGLIGFAKGLWVKALGLFGINDDGDGKLRNLEVAENAHSPNYEPGVRGWNIDSDGNMEAETIRVRSALEVDELRINRQQAQEGDTIYAENDQIESVEERYDETQGVMTYILTLKEKWEGYFTAQQYGNILRGKINTLAAKDAGVSDYTGQEYQASQQEDAGGNKYYTSFMQTIATHNTDQSLGVNQIRVVLFGDSEVPMSRNYPPCALMAIARWGCIDYSAEYEGTPQYNDVVRSIKRRQQSFIVLSSDGRIVKLTGVDSPILRNGNYGTTLGILPDFVQNYPTVHDRMIAGRDYLYAQGVVVGDFIKIDVEGNPIPTVVDKGEWQNNTPYYYNKFNETTQQYETHRVRHNGGTWQCLQSQPVIESGVPHYYEPKWNSPYWMLVDGNDNLTIEFVSSKGYSFRRGYVDTVITPHLFYGNVEIDADGTEIDAQYWNWTRSSESGKTTADEAWDAKHTGLVTGIKTLHLTNNDMPQTWSSANKAIFTCTVSVNDGKTTRIVDNQIIS